MRAYVVRIAKSRDLVGIFVAENINQLMWLVDEGLDPGGCEYASLGPGGMYWTEPAIEIPIMDPAPDDESGEQWPAIPWKECTLCEDWDMKLRGFGKLVWKCLAPVDLIPDGPS